MTERCSMIPGPIFAFPIPEMSGSRRTYIDGKLVTTVKPPRDTLHGDKVRQGLLDYIRAHGPCEIKAISAAAGLRSAGVRIHLSRLVADGKLLRIESRGKKERRVPVKWSVV